MGECSTHGSSLRISISLSLFPAVRLCISLSPPLPFLRILSHVSFLTPTGLVVLELGSGTGLCGLAALSLQSSRAILSDYCPPVTRNYFMVTIFLYSFILNHNRAYPSHNFCLILQAGHIRLLPSFSLSRNSQVSLPPFLHRMWMVP